MALVFLSQHVFIFLLFSSSEDEGATLYSLFDLPLSHSFAGRPLGQGSPRWDRWILALLPVLACHRQQMSWFLREHPFLVASQNNKIKKPSHLSPNLPYPTQQKSDLCLERTQTDSAQENTAFALFPLINPDTKTDELLRRVAAVVLSSNEQSSWCLSLLTDIQASLVHVGLRTVMGTSCLVNKHACKHKMPCASY